MSSSDDSWGYDEDEEVKEDSQIKPSRLPSDYEILSPHDIEHEQSRAINSVSETFGFSAKQGGNLLMKYCWNIKELSQAFIDGKCGELVNLDGDVIMPESHTETCLICFCECPSWSLRSLECGHFFCKSCYSNYLNEEVATGLMCLFTSCPMTKCELLVPESLFRELVDHASLKRYKKLIQNSFVELNPAIKWCPGPNCEFAIRYPADCRRDIVCQCGYMWCFQCSNEAHRPLTCEKLAKWREEQLGIGDLDDQWIYINTKHCPKCESPIQKNLGCMHMSCNCGHQFCWLCLGPWSEHGTNTGGYYKCNKFSEKRDKGDYKELEENKSAVSKKLKRLGYYIECFMEHKRSGKFAREKQKSLAGLSELIAKHVRSEKSLDVRFLKAAGDLIVEARSAIAYSYPLGFFLTNAKKLNFFQFMQADLERSLELLDARTDFNGENPFLCGNESSGYSLSAKFWSLKQEIEELTRIVGYHFEHSMQAMENELPLVTNSGKFQLTGELEEDPLTEELLLEQQLVGSDNWGCVLCTFINANSRATCEVCETPKPAN